MLNACRVTDNHACGNVDTQGCSNVEHNSLAAHGIGHAQAHCCTQAQGSPNVFVCNVAQARKGVDACGGCSCPLHPGTVQTSGSPNVFAN